MGWGKLLKVCFDTSTSLASPLNSAHALNKCSTAEQLELGIYTWGTQQGQQGHSSDLRWFRNLGKIPRQAQVIWSWDSSPDRLWLLTKSWPRTFQLFQAIRPSSQGQLATQLSPPSHSRAASHRLADTCPRASKTTTAFVRGHRERLWLAEPSDLWPPGSPPALCQVESPTSPGMVSQFQWFMDPEGASHFFLLLFLHPPPRTNRFHTLCTYCVWWQKEAPLAHILSAPAVRGWWLLIGSHVHFAGISSALCVVSGHQPLCSFYGFVGCQDPLPTCSRPGSRLWGWVFFLSFFLSFPPPSVCVSCSIMSNSLKPRGL